MISDVIFSVFFLESANFFVISRHVTIIESVSGL